MTQTDYPGPDVDREPDVNPDDPQTDQPVRDPDSEDPDVVNDPTEPQRNPDEPTE